MWTHNQISLLILQYEFDAEACWSWWSDIFPATICRHRCHQAACWHTAVWGSKSATAAQCSTAKGLDHIWPQTHATRRQTPKQSHLQAEDNHTHKWVWKPSHSQNKLQALTTDYWFYLGLLTTAWCKDSRGWAQPLLDWHLEAPSHSLPNLPGPILLIQSLHMS